MKLSKKGSAGLEELPASCFSPHFSNSPRISLSLAAQDEGVSTVLDVEEKNKFFFPVPPKPDFEKRVRTELQQLRRSWWSSGRHSGILWDPPAGDSGWCDHPAQTLWTWEAPSWKKTSKADSALLHSQDSAHFLGIKKKTKKTQLYLTLVSLEEEITNPPCVVLKWIMGGTENPDFGCLKCRTNFQTALTESPGCAGARGN